jgi:hypothetical protein
MFRAIRLAGQWPLSAEVKALIARMTVWPGTRWSSRNDDPWRGRPLEGRRARVECQAMRLAHDRILAHTETTADFSSRQACFPEIGKLFNELWRPNRFHHTPAVLCGSISLMTQHTVSHHQTRLQMVSLARPAVSLSEIALIAVWLTTRTETATLPFPAKAP